MSAVGGTGRLPLRLLLVGAAAVALLLAVIGGGLPVLSDAIGALVDAAGYDWALAAVLGGLATLAAVAVFVSGRGAAMETTEMPTVERALPVPSAGEGFEDTVGGWRFATRVFGGETAERVRERLRAAAVATVAADEGCTRDEARRRVEAGTWTDDPAAAAFLAGEYTPLRTWLRALAGGETGPEYRARRTVAAIVERRDEGDAHRDRESGR